MSDLARDTAGTLCVSVWRRCAEAQVLAVAICEMEQHPLNELQIAHLAQSFLSAFDGVQDELASHLSADAGLRTGQMRRVLGMDYDGK